MGARVTERLQVSVITGSVYLHNEKEDTAIPAVGTVEVVWMVRVVLEYQRLLVNDGVTLLADVFPKASGFLSVMAGATQVSKQTEPKLF